MIPKSIQTLKSHNLEIHFLVYKVIVNVTFIPLFF